VYNLTEKLEETFESITKIDREINKLDARINNLEREMEKFKEPSPTIIGGYDPICMRGYNTGPSSVMINTLLYLMEVGEATVDSVAKKVNRSRSLVSNYLDRLTDFYHYTRRIKKGKIMQYTLTDEGIIQVGNLKKDL